MQAVITGATGLLGANLAVLLREHGIDVRCTRRATSNTIHLEPYDIEWVEADLSSTSALTQAFDGADVIFHCAAAVSILRNVTQTLTQTNVDGTNNVLAAIQAADAGRLVHCSSTVAIGLSEDGMPATERNAWNLAKYGRDDGYATTKKQSEDNVLRAAADGLDAVVVNPGYLFGAFDQRPSSGRMLIDVVTRQVPGHSAGINNFANASDVAAGLVAAWKKGTRSERYILGGENLNYKECFQRIAAVAGTRPPGMSVPSWMAKPFGWLGDIQQRVTGREPLLNSNTIGWGYTKNFMFSSEKAIAELGYQPQPIEKGIAEALAWFRNCEMVSALPNFP